MLVSDVFLFLSLTDVSLDWSDHALWWPHKRMWLLRTRSTLDQYNVQADAHIWFTPMHKNLRVQLPDLQVMDMRVNFSSNVFSNVIKLCKEFGMYRVNISPLYFIISLGHRSLLLEIVSAILMSVIDIFYVIQVIIFLYIVCSDIQLCFITGIIWKQLRSVMIRRQW